MEPDFGKTMQGAMMGTGICMHHKCLILIVFCKPRFSAELMRQKQNGGEKTVDQALDDKKAKQKAGRKGKLGMIWDLEVKIIGGKNLMPKDTVGEGTYGTTFSHRCHLSPPRPLSLFLSLSRPLSLSSSLSLSLSLCLFPSL
jgi:hypothetical protein